MVDNLDLDDKQLIQKFLNGSDEAFEELVGRYLKPIYNFLYQFTRDADSLDDLTQETFIKVWKNIRKFDQSKTFRVWIYSIAKNTAYDFLKKKKTVPFSFFENFEGDNKLEKISDLKVNDQIVVMGNPGDNGVVNASLIRVFNNPATN